MLTDFELGILAGVSGTLACITAVLAIWAVIAVGAHSEDRLRVANWRPPIPNDTDNA